MPNRDSISFWVTGVEPGPQGSKRYLGVSSTGKPRFIEASEKVGPFREAVAKKIFETYVATGDDRAFSGPIVVWATFYVLKPHSVKRWLPTVAPDLDKYCRALGDGLEQNAHLVESDSQIVKWLASKVYVSERRDVGVKVTIRSVDSLMQQLELDPEQLEGWLDSHEL